MKTTYTYVRFRRDVARVQKSVGPADHKFVDETFKTNVLDKKYRFFFFFSKDMHLGYGRERALVFEQFGRRNVVSNGAVF